MEEEFKSEEVEERGEADYYFINPFFDEADSDAETEDDFSETRTFAEFDPWTYGTTYYSYEKKRGCIGLNLFHNCQHHIDFEGVPIVELFKVTAILNKNYTGTPFTGGRLYGEIVTVPDPVFNPDPISYYSACHDEPNSIRLDADHDFVLLPISGPKPRPPICENNTVALDFAFTIDGQDIFTSGNRRENPQLFGNDGCTARQMLVSGLSDRGSRLPGPYILRTVVGTSSCDPVVMAAYYGVYEGVWAKIDVKMLRDDGVGSFYGLIVARPCVFYHRFRLLTIQQDQKLTIEAGEGDGKTRFIKLTRSAVAVPSYSSLIIGASLYGDDDQPICHGKAAFAARESGEETSIISYNGVETLEVSVQWKCQR